MLRERTGWGETKVFSAEVSSKQSRVTPEVEITQKIKNRSKVSQTGILGK